ncbi:hypothetical protein [Domibacillus aminovorans]|uniref:hypothetical protein n=1 Tax=Domibacillus aminovorans TaxID=29332 RepID=UPI0039F5AD1A
MLTIPILQTIFYAIRLLFLIYMGWSIWNSNPANLSQKETAMPPKKQILLAMSVSRSYF